MNKKKIIIIIISSIIVLLLIVATIFLLNRNQSQKQLNNLNGNKKTFVPDILSNEEKTKMDIPTNIKIQSLKRSIDNEVMVYKIIKNDSEVVDPENMNAISPHAKK